MKKRVLTVITLIFCLSFALLNAQVEILGAGATFPYPLYSKMFDDYNSKTGVKVNYQGIGSGGGIRQLISKTVDFGGTDAIVTNDKMIEAGAAIVHVPICLGAIVLTYNLPGNPTLKMTPELIADIYLGKIVKWNDRRLQAFNPKVKLPSIDIAVVRRSDGSGSTSIFTNYLTKVSPEWKKSVGEGTSVNWPVGIGAKGNPGVAGLVQQVPGSIGYVELNYAISNKMPYAIVRNKSGKYINPTINSVSISAAVKLPNDTMVSLTNTSAPQGYPISGFTWIILYKDQNYSNRNITQAKETVKLLKWMLTEGQKHASPLNYSPLSKEAQKKAMNLVNSITFAGKKI